ncbi:ABC transporter ATP-binding protein [Corynebacterium variabile]|uniref:ABC transporter ATP-binding protein n=1 Tax=Corynebacterium variabile TaxID=1727 RepID=UPI001D2FCF02|nr:phosphate ABC transporter ATP-binding protein [Corynebacterium variabile]HJG45035.1 phosphate ABC transporter ATP-binding protein [Corynebacterium variabile]
MREPLFTFEDVTLVHDGRPILDHVTLDIPTGGITAVTGPSGSGKSTLLRCCNLLEVPTSGRILYCGTPLTGSGSLDPLTLRRQVAMVFQRPTVFAGTAFDNLRAADGSLDEDAATALLSEVGLEASYLDREADTLSGGESQRLCLARALATEPDVLLADEVTSALDEDATGVLEDLAQRLVAPEAQGGRDLSVLWVSHDPAQVQRIADRSIRIDAGQVTA